jgi:general secretion pathway protein N
MRFRLPLGRSVFFVSAFLFALVALLPLRLALDWLALDGAVTAREAQGSIWLGNLAETQLGAVPLGNLQAQLRSLPLFVGRARVDLRRSDDNQPLEGAATVTRHSFGIDDLKGRVDLGALLAPLPVTSIELADMSFRFANGLCVRAEGRVKAIVTGQLAGLGLAGGLGGGPRCDRGALLLPLTSQSGMERLNIRLFNDGRYRFDLSVRPTSPALVQRLSAAGFTPAADGSYAVSRAGAF